MKLALLVMLASISAAAAGWINVPEAERTLSNCAGQGFSVEMYEPSNRFMLLSETSGEVDFESWPIGKDVDDISARNFPVEDKVIDWETSQKYDERNTAFGLSFRASLETGNNGEEVGYVGTYGLEAGKYHVLNCHSGTWSYTCTSHIVVEVTRCPDEVPFTKPYMRVVNFEEGNGSPLFRKGSPVGTLMSPTTDTVDGVGAICPNAARSAIHFNPRLLTDNESPIDYLLVVDAVLSGTEDMEDTKSPTSFKPDASKVYDVNLRNMFSWGAYDVQEKGRRYEVDCSDEENCSELRCNSPASCFLFLKPEFLALSLDLEDSSKISWKDVAKYNHDYRGFQCKSFVTTYECTDNIKFSVLPGDCPAEEHEKGEKPFEDREVIVVKDPVEGGMENSDKMPSTAVSDPNIDTVAESKKEESEAVSSSSSERVLEELTTALNEFKGLLDGGSDTDCEVKNDFIDRLDESTMSNPNAVCSRPEQDLLISIMELKQATVDAARASGESCSTVGEDVEEQLRKMVAGLICDTGRE